MRSQSSKDADSNSPLPYVSPTNSEGTQLQAYTTPAYLRNFITKVRRPQDLVALDDPAGFLNPQNVWCYRNAVLVLLLNTVPFTTYFQRFLKPWSQTQQFTNLVPDFIAIFKDLVENYEDPRLRFQQNDRPSNPFDQIVDPLWNGLQTIRDPMMQWDWVNDRTGHEDASEFLMLLLNNFRYQMEQANGFRQRQRYELLASVKMARYTVCAHHPNAKQRQSLDTDMTMQVHVPKGPKGAPMSVITLEQCITRSFHQTTTGYRCDKCQKANRPAQDAASREKIYASPEVLFITLNRISESAPGSGRTKGSRPVEVPEELDLAQWQEPKGKDSSGPVKYRLVGAIMHQGTLNYGHYTNIVCRNRSDGDVVEDVWYNVNNAEVTELQNGGMAEINVRPANAHRAKSEFLPYVLAYVRKYDNGEQQVERRSSETTSNSSDPKTTPTQTNPKKTPPRGTSKTPEAEVAAGKNVSKSTRSKSPDPKATSARASPGKTPARGGSKTPEPHFAGDQSSPSEQKSLPIQTEPDYDQSPIGAPANKPGPRSQAAIAALSHWGTLNPQLIRYTLAKDRLGSEDPRGFSGTFVPLPQFTSRIPTLPSPPPPPGWIPPPPRTPPWYVPPIPGPGWQIPPWNPGRMPNSPLPDPQVASSRASRSPTLAVTQRVTQGPQRRPSSPLPDPPPARSQPHRSLTPAVTQFVSQGTQTSPRQAAAKSPKTTVPTYALRGTQTSPKSSSSRPSPQPFPQQGASLKPAQQQQPLTPSQASVDFDKEVESRATEHKDKVRIRLELVDAAGNMLVQSDRFVPKFDPNNISSVKLGTWLGRKGEEYDLSKSILAFLAGIQPQSVDDDDGGKDGQGNGKGDGKNRPHSKGSKGSGGDGRSDGGNNSRKRKRSPVSTPSPSLDKSAAVKDAADGKDDDDAPDSRKNNPTSKAVSSACEDKPRKRKRTPTVSKRPSPPPATKATTSPTAQAQTSSSSISSNAPEDEGRRPAKRMKTTNPVGKRTPDGPVKKPPSPRTKKREETPRPATTKTNTPSPAPKTAKKKMMMVDPKNDDNESSEGEQVKRKRKRASSVSAVEEEEEEEEEEGEGEDCAEPVSKKRLRTGSAEAGRAV